MDEIVAGIAGVAATLGLFWVYYVLRERRRQLQGNPRLKRFSSEGTARIPVEYEDRPGKELPTRATSLSGSFTLRVEKRDVIADRHQPSLLGDPSVFWSSCLRTLRAGPFRT
jgi:hypothetical protein